MIDADGSTDPAEIPVRRGPARGADFAKGTRFAPGGGSCDITRLRRLGNRVLSALSTCCVTPLLRPVLRLQRLLAAALPVFGLTVNSDIPAGSGTRLWGDGFEVETLINIRIAQPASRSSRSPATSTTGSTASATSTPPATAGASCARSSPTLLPPPARPRDRHRVRRPQHHAPPPEGGGALTPADRSTGKMMQRPTADRGAGPPTKRRGRA